MKSPKERMLAGEPYIAIDPELGADHHRAQAILARFNSLPADADHDRLVALRELLGHLGQETVVRPPLRCDYGYNVSVGARTFINFECVLLDCHRIVIGDEVQIGPGVHIYTATHPLEAAARRAGWESAQPVVIGNGVWLGGRAVVCPGVTIGENTVVGAGSVVTRDLPPNVLAAGVPCRVIRPL